MTAPQAAIVIPRMSTGRGLNDRIHWTVRAKVVKEERGRVIWAWLRAEMAGLQLPPAPWHVKLFRCSPADGLDFVNLCGSLKAVQDQVAAQLHLRDDREAKAGELDRATWSFHEETRTKWGVRVEISTRAAAQGVTG